MNGSEFFIYDHHFLEDKIIKYELMAARINKACYANKQRYIN